MNFISFRIILKRIKAIRYLMSDKTVPLRKKALVIFGIVYLLAPVDLIPIAIFPVGIMDDLILWTFIIWHLKDQLDTYWLGEKKGDLSQKYSREDIVDGVDFTVENSEEEDSHDKE